MRKVGIQLLSDDTTIAMLAGDADNESMWDEISDAEFESNTLKGLTVEISGNEYIYTLKNLCDIEFCFVDLETCEVLSDSITLGKVFDAFGTHGDITIKKLKDGGVVANILGETVVFLKTKLVSFKNDRLIIQIVM